MNLCKSFILSFLLVGFYKPYAQLVITNGAIINVNGGTVANPISVVLNSPPATPIKTVGAGTNGIMLESEYNRVHYNLDQATTAIAVPYVSKNTGSLVVFPLAVYNITAGTHTAGKTGAIRFSSTKTSGAMNAGWDDYNYKPSQVLNTCGPSAACVNNSNVNDNSANVIDRFWIIEPVYYTAAGRPAVTLDFTYLMGETDLNGGNTANLAVTLQPQRFDTVNTGTPIWGWNGFPATAAQQGTNTPAGSITATSVGTLTGVQVSAANFFPDWTLSNYLIPLPVEIVKYTGICENKNVTLNWTSTHEINSDYYTIEKSFDGVNFSLLTTVAASGNSNQNTAYTYIDVSPSDNGISYYRLSETDKNGAKKTFNVVTVSGCSTSANENGTIYSYQNQVNINLYSLSNQNISVTAYDVTGRLIYQNQVFAAEGNNNIKLNPPLAQGVYLFELKTEKLSVVKRILIEN